MQPAFRHSQSRLENVVHIASYSATLAIRNMSSIVHPLRRMVNVGPYLSVQHG